MSLPAVQLALAMAISGTLGIFVREANLPATDAVFWRCVFGAVAMAGWCWFRGLLRGPWPDRRDTLLALGAAVTIVTNWVMVFEAFRWISITLTTIVYHIQPFYLLLLSFLVFGERTGWAQLVWLVVALAGLILAVGVDPGLEADRRSVLIGVALSAGAAFFYALSVLCARAIRGTRPELVAFAQAAIGAVCLTALNGGLGSPVAPAAWPWLVGLGVIHAGIVYVLMYAAYPKLSGSTIAVLTFVYPLSALVSDAMWFGTPLSVWQIAGLGLIILATVAVQRGWRLL